MNVMVADDRNDRNIRKIVLKRIGYKLKRLFYVRLGCIPLEMVQKITGKINGINFLKLFKLRVFCESNLASLHRQNKIQFECTTAIHPNRCIQMYM